MRPPYINPAAFKPPLLDWLRAHFHSPNYLFTLSDGTLPEHHSSQLLLLVNHVVKKLQPQTLGRIYAVAVEERGQLYDQVFGVFLVF